MAKQRIDRVLVLRGLAPSRERARAMILAGSVVIGDRTVDKPGTLVSDEEAIRIRGEPSPYVSRGGQKLERALDAFEISPAGKLALDIGASTGGFTDCLLQRGARGVHALDVGYGQLAWTLRQDVRVVCHERTNIRHVTPDVFPEPFDLITIDVSFISLTLVLPVALTLLAPAGEMVALIKPQFEVGKGDVGKKGVVRDPEKHRAVVEKIQIFAGKIGLVPCGVIESPLAGPMGNKEFLMYFKRRACHEPS